MADLPNTVEMTISYTKHADGTFTEVRKIGERVIYEGPCPIVFLEIRNSFPWESKFWSEE